MSSVEEIPEVIFLGVRENPPEAGLFIRRKDSLVLTSYVVKDFVGPLTDVIGAGLHHPLPQTSS